MIGDSVVRALNHSIMLATMGSNQYISPFSNKIELPNYKRKAIEELVSHYFSSKEKP